MLRRAAPRREDQRGFTLVELTVAMTIMLLVSGALLAALDSGTKAERRASTRIDDEQTVRVALAQLTHDVRNANALLPATNPDQIELGYADGAIVRWWYDPVGRILRREVPSVQYPGGWDFGITVPNLTNTTGTVFTLLAADRTNLLTLPGANITDALTCTSIVDVSVTDAAHPPSAPFTETVDPPLTTSADRRGCS